MPEWSDDQLQRVAEMHAGQPAERRIDSAVEHWWEQLRAGLREEADRMRRREVDADFEQLSPTCYEVRNPEAALVLAVELDADARTVHFDYRSESEHTAAPEGGFFSLRPRGNNRIVAFYADQEMTPDRLLRTLLKPVLLPAEPTEEAA